MDLIKINQIACDEMSEKVHWTGEKGGKYYHGKRVAKLALELKKYILPNDGGEHDDIMTVAGWFHDCMHAENEHHLAGAERAKILLADYCSDDELREIYDIIYRHGDKHSGRDTLSVYAKIHQDADDLDHLGTSMIWIEFLLASHNGKDVFETIAKLKEMQKMFSTCTEAGLNFDISKKVCRERIEFSRLFIERFSVEGTGRIWGEESLREGEAGFYFIRHGEPDYSQGGKTIYNGIGNNFMPLTLKGINQIKKTAKDKRLLDADIIISSPYTRALQSAAILSKELQIDLLVEPNLFEWYGNKKYNADHDESSDLLEEFVANSGDYPDDMEMQWEDNRMMRERVFKTLDKYTHYKKVIVVCHNILIRSLKPWDQNRFIECGEIVEFEYGKKDSGSAITQNILKNNRQEKNSILDIDYTPEYIEVIRTAKSPEELIATAKGAGIELTQKQAEAVLIWFGL